eukprot:scaffold5509_cov194-Ochromonas_danica.AAC.1
MYSMAPTRAPTVASQVTTVVASNSSTATVQVSGQKVTIGGLTNSSVATVTVTSSGSLSSSSNSNASSLASKLESDIVTVTVSNSSSSNVKVTVSISVSSSSTSKNSSSLSIFEHNCTSEKREEVVFNCSDADVLYNLTCSGEAAAEVKQQCPVSQLQCSVIDMNTYNVVDSDYCTVVSTTSTSVLCRCGYSSNSSSSSTSPPSSSPTSKSGSVSVAVTSDYVAGDFSATVSGIGGISSAAAVEGTTAVLSAFGGWWLVGLLLIGSLLFRVDWFGGWCSGREMWKKVEKMVQMVWLCMVKGMRGWGVVMPLDESPSSLLKELGNEGVGEEEKAMRVVWMRYVLEVMPKVYRPLPWLHRMLGELCSRHEYLDLLFGVLGFREEEEDDDDDDDEESEDKMKKKGLREKVVQGEVKQDQETRRWFTWKVGLGGRGWKMVSDVLRLWTSFTISCFLLAWLYDLQYPDDDGSCGQHVTRVSCLAKKSPLDSSQSYCKWVPAQALVAGLLVESKKSTVLSSTTLSSTLTDDELHEQCQYADEGASLLATMLVAVVVSFISTVVMSIMAALFSMIMAPTAKVRARRRGKVSDEVSEKRVEDGEGEAQGREEGEEEEEASWSTLGLYLLGELLRVDLLGRVARANVSEKLRRCRGLFLQEMSKSGRGVLEVREENEKGELQQYQAKQEGSVLYRDEECGEVTKADVAKELSDGSSEVLNTAMQQAHEKLLCHAEDSDARANTLLHLCLFDLVLHEPLLHANSSSPNSHNAKVAGKLVWQTMMKNYRMPAPR